MPMCRRISGIQTMISRSLVVTVRSESWHWKLTHLGHFHEFVHSCNHAVCSGHTPSLIERHCLMIVLSIREVCSTFLKVDIHFYFTFGAMNKWDHCVWFFFFFCLKRHHLFLFSCLWCLIKAAPCEHQPLQLFKLLQGVEPLQCMTALII